HDSASPALYTLSLHDALPISCTWTTEYSVELFSGDAMGAPRRFSLPKEVPPGASVDIAVDMNAPRKAGVYQGNWMLRNPSGGWLDRKSTRLNSSHVKISYAVF